MPEVLGLDQNGQEITLSSLAGKKLVLYAYPKDNTSGCTAEACSLRDHYDELQQAGYVVIGVSKDSAASHQKFIDKQQLPFPLHADAEPQLCQPGQRFTIVPPQPQSRRQKADDAALSGFPIGFAGLKFGVRAPRLQRRRQPKQQRCHHPTSFPASASRTAFSSASSMAFAVCAGASASRPLPTVKLWAGASAKLLYICCAYCASAALEGSA